ncbi:MAG: flavin reductase [Planctomycetaceae bacterium]|nr:flavin reductase [Planctomycetaceae bacterium]
MPISDDLKTTIAPVLGRLPSGVFILTSLSGDGQETGMLASWVQQAAFDPPMLTVAVNAKRYLNDWLRAGQPLAVSIVGEAQVNLFSHFGKGFDPGENAFEGVEVERTPLGVPALKDSIGWIEGRPVGSVAAGDHIVYAVEVTAAASKDRLATERPFVHIRKNGFNY